MSVSRPMTAEERINTIARVCHEANRGWCSALGDESQLPWDEAPVWLRASVLNGVEGVLHGNGPETSHLSWLNEKKAAGWKYGPVRDPQKKEHPCYVSYDQLPAMHKIKDDLFVSIVRTLAPKLGLMSV